MLLNQQSSAWAALPLIVDDRPIGALGLSFDAPQAFDGDEIAYLVTLAGQCAQALERARLYDVERSARLELEARVVERTTELRQEVAERRQSQVQMEQIREAERERIARELHDALGGALTGLKMSVRRLAKQPETAPATAQALADLARETDDIIAAVRRISTELRPSLLDHFGLVAALEQLLQDFGRRTGLAAAFQSQVEELSLSANKALACYRVVQEALTNVARHAQATQVAVTLALDDGHVEVCVADNGRGLAPAARGAGRLGLVGMRERAALVAGTPELDSQPNRGTTVRLAVPLDGALA